MEKYAEFATEAEALEAYRNTGKEMGHAGWLIDQHLGEAIRVTMRSTIGVFILDRPLWVRALQKWRNAIATCPWRAEMRAEIDAFTAGDWYPDTDPNLVMVFFFAVRQRRCDMIEQLAPRVEGHPSELLGNTLRYAGSKKLLPVLNLLFATCPITKENTSVISALTKVWMLPHSYPVLRATFDDATLAKHWNSKSWGEMRAYGVHS